MWRPYIKIRKRNPVYLTGNFPTQEKAIRQGCRVAELSYGRMKPSVYKLVSIGAHLI